MSIDILIVDDTPQNLQLLSEMLLQRGYRVLNANDGEEAFEIVEKTIPDLILLDIKMPGLNGYEVCHRLQSVPKTQQIPIIFMSAVNDVAGKVKAFEAGGVDYITKPFQVSEVLARVGTQIKISQLSKQLHSRNQQLARQNQQLTQEVEKRKQAQKAQKVFLHTLSHDLHNPVVGISMTLETFLLQKDSEFMFKREVVEGMWHSCEHQKRLIRSLVEAEKIEKEGIFINKKPVFLSHLIKVLLQEWQPQFKKHEVKLKLNISSNLPQILADEDQLWRVFENLLGNALKYNPPGLTITLSATYEEGYICCRVMNDGVQIPIAESEQLFNLYTRGKNTKGKEGLGLGLYICQQIIQAHRGKIGVESSNNGTCFWFTIPVSGVQFAMLS